MSVSLYIICNAWVAGSNVINLIMFNKLWQLTVFMFCKVPGDEPYTAMDDGLILPYVAVEFYEHCLVGLIVKYDTFGAHIL